MPVAPRRKEGGLSRSSDGRAQLCVASARADLPTRLRRAAANAPRAQEHRPRHQPKSPLLPTREEPAGPHPKGCRRDRPRQAPATLRARQRTLGDHDRRAGAPWQVRMPDIPDPRNHRTVKGRGNHGGRRPPSPELLGDRQGPEGVTLGNGKPGEGRPAHGAQQVGVRPQPGKTPLQGEIGKCDIERQAGHEAVCGIHRPDPVRGD